MEHKSFNVSLLRMIRLKHDVTRTLHLFNVLYGSLCTTDNVAECMHNRFLCIATAYDHTELVTLLITQLRCNFDPSVDLISSSVSTAVEDGNLKLVELFVRASSSRTLKDADDTTDSDSQREDRLLAAVECACWSDQYEVLRLLVSIDVERGQVER